MVSMRVCSTDGRDGGDNLAQLELVQDGGLTGGIQSDHQDTHLLLAEERAEQLSKRVSHGCSWRNRNERNKEL